VKENLVTDTGTSSDVKGTAQEQAQQVAGTTKEEATQVVGTAKEQVQAVTSDVREQTRQLADEARGQLMDQAGSQRDRAVESLRSVGGELSQMADSADGSGLGVQLAREAGSVTSNAADFLEQHEPAELVDELRNLARRRPGAFLLGAAVAGLVVGRLTRSAKSAHSSDTSGSTDGGRSSMDYAYASQTAYTTPGTQPSVEADAWGPDAPTYPATTDYPASGTSTTPLSSEPGGTL
jgi:uncharacterized protein YjbJ (UPF0337 family)